MGKEIPVTTTITSEMIAVSAESSFEKKEIKKNDRET